MHLCQARTTISGALQGRGVWRREGQGKRAARCTGSCHILYFPSGFLGVFLCLISISIFTCLRLVRSRRELEGGAEDPASGGAHALVVSFSSLDLGPPLLFSYFLLCFGVMNDVWLQFKFYLPRRCLRAR